MTWQGIEGHDNVVEKLRRAVARNRLASSFLFCGPAGVGKRAFALRFAQALLCATDRPPAGGDLDPCNACPSCAMALAGTHPDIEVVAKPEDKAFLPVELFLGDLQHRGREGLCHWIGLKPFMGGRRIAIIDDADLFNDAGANCLLKTLEEPPPQSVLILIGTSPARQLPTIRSRCQLIRFLPLPEETVARLLISKGLVTAGPTTRGRRKRRGWPVSARGACSRRSIWPTPTSGVVAARCWRNCRPRCWIAWGWPRPLPPSSTRRARRRLPGGPGSARWWPLPPTFIAVYCTLRSDLPLPSDPELRGPLEVAMQHFRGDAIVAAACLERCLEALGQIDRNANQATLIEAWLDDLAVEATC